MRKWMVCLLILAVLMLAVTAIAEEPQREVITSGDWQYVVLEDGTAEIVNYTGGKSNIIIPSEIEGVTVERIGDKAFGEDHLHIKSVEIPNCVLSIGENPFYGCAYLKNIYVSPEHKTLAVIEDVLFCKNDKQLICYPANKENNDYSIPNGIKVIGAYAFSNCSGLSEISLPDSIVRIDDYAFFRCTRLESINIPSGVAYIGKNPFTLCSWLYDLKVDSDNPNFLLKDDVLYSLHDSRLVSCSCFALKWRYEVLKGTQIIDDHAFCSCKSLREIVLPEDVQYIGKWAFEYCESLATVTIPRGVSIINEGTFLECSELENIELPNGLEIIDDFAFCGCIFLDKVLIPETVSFIGNDAFARCKSLRQIAIPSKVNALSHNVFSKCESLEDVRLPESLVSIGNNAFSECENLYEIEVPDSVVSVGEDSFLYCPNLTIVGNRDSFIIKYCEKNHIRYSYPQSLDWLSAP